MRVNLEDVLKRGSQLVSDRRITTVLQRNVSVFFVEFEGCVRPLNTTVRHPHATSLGQVIG